MEMMVDGIKKGGVAPVIRWEQKFQHGYPQLELGLFDHYFRPWGVLTPLHNPFPVEFNLRMPGSDEKEIFIPEGSLFSVYSADTGEIELDSVPDIVSKWKEQTEEERNSFFGDWLPLSYCGNRSSRPISFHKGVVVRFSYKVLYFMPSLAKIMFV
jgi:hypothetical protein